MSKWWLYALMSAILDKFSADKEVSKVALNFHNAFILCFSLLIIYYSLVYLSFHLEHLSEMRGMLLLLFLISHNYVRVIIWERNKANIF